MRQLSSKAVAMELSALYKATMDLYLNYFDLLETAIHKTPLSEAATLNELSQLAEEGKKALEEDLLLFEKTLATDKENLQNFENNLKIQDIYEFLKQK